MRCLIVLCVILFPLASHAKVTLPELGTIRVEGPILETDIEPFQKRIAAVNKLGNGTLRIILDSPGGSVEAVSYLIGAVQVYQRKGGVVTMEVPDEHRCWSICPLLFAFGDRRIAHLGSSWMFHEITADRQTLEIVPEWAIERQRQVIIKFWLHRYSRIDPALTSRMILERWFDHEKFMSGADLGRIQHGLFTGVWEILASRK